MEQTAPKHSHSTKELTTSQGGGGRVVAEMNQLVILLHSAENLARVDKNDTVDAFFHLSVKSGSEIRDRWSKVVHSQSPEWKEEHRFDDIKFESTEVVVLVKNKNVGSISLSSCELHRMDSPSTVR